MPMGLGHRAMCAVTLCAVLVIAVSLSDATAQRSATPERQIPPSRAALRYSFAPIVRRATPAVVSLSRPVASLTAFATPKSVTRASDPET